MKTDYLYLSQKAYDRNMEEPWMIAHTVESRTDEEDWNEVCESMYHRDVTVIQSATFDLIKNLRDDIDHYYQMAARKWKHLDEEQIVNGVDEMLDRRTQELQKEKDKLIWILQETLAHRKELSRAHFGGITRPSKTS